MPEQRKRRFCHFHKLVVMATSLEISGKKEVQIDRLHPKRFHSLKRRSSSIRHAGVRKQIATSLQLLQQVALLSQRDRATCFSVEILQLQNIAIVWHYLRDPTFSRFYTIPKCDRHTHTDGRTDTRRRHVLRLA